MRRILGDMLYTAPPVEDAEAMPSPEKLRGKVLVKAKRLPPGKSQVWKKFKLFFLFHFINVGYRFVQDDDLEDEDDEEERDEKKKKTAKVKF